jgi:hypothetical protein
MATSKLRDQDGEDDLIDHVVRHYGLTRDQAREVVRRHREDPMKIDAAAGDIKAGRRPEHR